MNLEMILDGVLLVAMALSFALLHKVRRLSVALWSTGPSYRCLPTDSNLEQPTEIDQIFRA